MSENKTLKKILNYWARQAFSDITRKFFPQQEKADYTELHKNYKKPSYPPKDITKIKNRLKRKYLQIIYMMTMNMNSQ